MYDPNYIKFNMCRVKDKEEMRRRRGRRESGEGRRGEGGEREEEAEKEAVMPPFGWVGRFHAHIICFSVSLSYFLHFTERKMRHREVK